MAIVYSNKECPRAFYLDVQENGKKVMVFKDCGTWCVFCHQDAQIDQCLIVRCGPNPELVDKAVIR